MSKPRRTPRTFRAVTLLAVLGLMATLLAACGGSSQPAATTGPSQSGSTDAANLLETRCSGCHGVNSVTRERLSASQWEQMVANMMQRGTQLSDAEKAALVRYLAANYGQ
jgi:mono/diheme cytochrome c family protein